MNALGIRDKTAKVSKMFWLAIRKISIPEAVFIYSMNIAFFSVNTDTRSLAVKNPDLAHPFRVMLL